ncbi:MAG TPA: YHS domain-containing (seleno)protein, partial [Flavobacteriales bacterium]|nr:YHS domain-containing (seleno)protein [Flavobacteriales bacterium]
MRSFLLSLTLLGSVLVQGQTLMPYFNVDDDGVWVEGYDPVAYLVQGKPLKGSAQITTTYKGATFHF